MRAFTWLICDAIVEHDHALAEGVLPEALAYAIMREESAFEARVVDRLRADG